MDGVLKIVLVVVAVSVVNVWLIVDCIRQDRADARWHREHTKRMLALVKDLGKPPKSQW